MQVPPLPPSYDQATSAARAPVLVDDDNAPCHTRPTEDVDNGPVHVVDVVDAAAAARPNRHRVEDEQEEDPSTETTGRKRRLRTRWSKAADAGNIPEMNKLLEVDPSCAYDDENVLRALIQHDQLSAYRWFFGDKVDSQPDNTNVDWTRCRDHFFTVITEACVSKIERYLETFAEHNDLGLSVEFTMRDNEDNTTEKKRFVFRKP